MSAVVIDLPKARRSRSGKRAWAERKARRQETLAWIEAERHALETKLRRLDSIERQLMADARR